MHLSDFGNLSVSYQVLSGAQARPFASGDNNVVVDGTDYRSNEGPSVPVRLRHREQPRRQHQGSLAILSLRLPRGSSAATPSDITATPSAGSPPQPLRSAPEAPYSSPATPPGPTPYRPTPRLLHRASRGNQPHRQQPPHRQRNRPTPHITKPQGERGSFACAADGYYGHALFCRPQMIQVTDSLVAGIVCCRNTRMECQMTAASETEVAEERSPQPVPITQRHRPLWG